MINLIKLKKDLKKKREENRGCYFCYTINVQRDRDKKVYLRFFSYCVKKNLTDPNYLQPYINNYDQQPPLFITPIFIRGMDI